MLYLGFFSTLGSFGALKGFPARNGAAPLLQADGEGEREGEGEWGGEGKWEGSLPLGKRGPRRLQREDKHPTSFSLFLGITLSLISPAVLSECGCV